MEVKAYKAKDGSLHEFKEDQLIRDNELVIDDGIKMLSDVMVENAPYSDDWRANALSGEDDMKYVLKILMRDQLTVIKSLVFQQEKLNALLAAKEAPIKIAKKAVAAKSAKKPARKK